MQRTPEDGFAGLIYGRGLGVALPSGGFLLFTLRYGSLNSPACSCVSITLSLPCGEQKRQNLSPREMLGNKARDPGSSVRVTRAG
jgi:hypothetical protein